MRVLLFVGALAGLASRSTAIPYDALQARQGEVTSQGAPRVYPTAVTTTVTNGPETRVEVVISGGPITNPVTLPGPRPTPFEQGGAEAQMSVSSLSSALISAAFPKATEWINSPAPEQATSAVQAIEILIPDVGNLINNLPGGSLVADCASLVAPPVVDVVEENLVRDLNELVCDLFDILAGLHREIPDAVGMRIDIDKAQSEIGSIASQVLARDAQGDGPVVEPPSGPNPDSR